MGAIFGDDEAGVGRPLEVVLLQSAPNRVEPHDVVDSGQDPEPEKFGDSCDRSDPIWARGLSVMMDQNLPCCLVNVDSQKLKCISATSPLSEAGSTQDWTGRSWF